MSARTRAWLAANIRRSMPRWMRANPPEHTARQVLEQTQDHPLAGAVYDELTNEQDPAKHTEHVRLRERALRRGRS